MAGEPMLRGATAKAVVAAVLNRDTLLADFPRREELEKLEDREFYPLSLYLELCDYLETRLGTYAWLRVGRRMATAVMDQAFPKGLNVEEAIAQIDAAHEYFCSPLVGAFELVERAQGRLVVHYTAPYNCTLQEGLFYEVAIRHGAPGATVIHTDCRRTNGKACRFEISY